MPRFHFTIGRPDALGEMGAVQSDSFDDALEALAEQAAPSVGDVLEIGVPGFPPARYEYVKVGRRTRAWKPAGLLAA
jgi:hypothetical protein